MMWVCSNCGSTNVQTKMWVNLNNNKVEGDASDDSDDNWCDGCDRHGDVEQKEIEIKRFEVYQENVHDPEISDLVGIFEGQTQDEVRQQLDDAEGLTVIEIP